MRANEKRSILFLFLILLVGAAAGTALSSFVGLTMPDGVVRDFFLNSKPLGWDPFTMNLQIITLTTGFTIDISVSSIIGMVVAWYFLRYFR
jgi:ABC-type antimicrobial peptide transport system permease subunit